MAKIAIALHTARKNLTKWFVFVILNQSKYSIRQHFKNMINLESIFNQKLILKNIRKHFKTNGGFNLDDGANLEKNKYAIEADFGHSNKDDKAGENGKDGEEEQEITAITDNINRGENSEASAAHPVNSNSWPRMVAETSDHRTSSRYSQYREVGKGGIGLGVGLFCPILMNPL